MKRLMLISVLVMITMLAGASLAFAQTNDFEARGPGGRGGPGGGGEVTAVSSDSLTVEMPNGDSRTFTLTDETEVHLVERGTDGTVDDISVGDNVHVRPVRGSRDDDSPEAEAVAILPDGEPVGGRVLSVDGPTITIENRDGEFTINTDGETTFRLNREGEAGSLDDIEVGMGLRAFGTLDGNTLDASFVASGEGGPGRGDGGPCRDGEGRGPGGGGGNGQGQGGQGGGGRN